MWESTHIHTHPHTHSDVQTTCWHIRTHTHTSLVFLPVLQDMPKPLQPNFILDVETSELFIQAGLQDRVIQVSTDRHTGWSYRFSLCVWGLKWIKFNHLFILHGSTCNMNIWSSCRKYTCTVCTHAHTYIHTRVCSSTRAHIHNNTLHIGCSPVISYYSCDGVIFLFFLNCSLLYLRKLLRLIVGEVNLGSVYVRDCLASWRLCSMRRQTNRWLVTNL